ncbi:MAG: ribonuclease E activity regulator RraA [Gammaproteobacteria bacterium]|nr:ribonuclease E activity regulator RraA [Gammaproteobacteria bacterium]
MTFKTADLCDVNEGKVQVVHPGLSNFGGNAQFCGEMVTISAQGDFSRVREQVNLPGDGKVLVVDNDGAMHCAMLGDLLAAAAVENGWRGVIINGCIRDSAEIAGMNIGIRALASLPARGARQEQGVLNVEVHFLGAIFRPGEFLYSDEDGILLSPEALAT